MDVIFDRGVYLPELDFWMDSRRKQEVSLISHGHSDHRKVGGVVRQGVNATHFARYRGYVHNLAALPLIEHLFQDGLSAEERAGHLDV